MAFVYLSSIEMVTLLWAQYTKRRSMYKTKQNDECPDPALTDVMSLQAFIITNRLIPCQNQIQ